MVKTRSQTGQKTIKKEEEEDCKSTLGLNNATVTTRSKITKRKSAKNKNNLPVEHVKVEEDTDTKSLLQSPPKYSKSPKVRRVLQEQINQLIDAIVNDNMSVRKAASTVKISITTARYYYNQYKNDPEKKIPLPRNQLKQPKTYYTQEQVENLIRYIVDDKMSIPNASAKTAMSYGSGLKYYTKYLRDPDHNIPIMNFKQIYTQDQKDDFISYIINDKMNITEASKKAKMHIESGRGYYHKYFDDQNPGITTPSHITCFTHHTQEQIKKLISYIVDDKLTVYAASKKVNMSQQSATIHYRRYLKDNNMEFPVTQYGKPHTQEKIDEVIGYIVGDKMSIRAASKKANMTVATGTKHYRRYLIDHKLDLPAPKYTQAQKHKLIGYIIDDKMNIREASRKANLSYGVGHQYFQKYRKDHNLPLSVSKRISQDQIRELIGYIFDDKMTVYAAAKKTNISYKSGKQYYLKYLKDKKRGAPI